MILMKVQCRERLKTNLAIFHGLNSMTVTIISQPHIKKHALFLLTNIKAKTGFKMLSSTH